MPTFHRFRGPVGVAILFCVAMTATASAQAPSKKASPTGAAADGVSKELIELEKKLIRLAVKGRSPELEKLIADDFTQILSTGIQTREETLSSLVASELVTMPKMTDFQTTQVSPDVVLLTYRSQFDEAPAQWVSSLWVRRDGAWKNVFYQATDPPPEGTTDPAAPAPPPPAK